MFSLIVLLMSTIASVSFLYPVSAVATEWDLNDVSILLPLPQSQSEMDELISLDAVGARGQLFPLKYYQFEYPSAIAPPLEQDRQWPFYKVLAMRVDPCGPAAMESKEVCSRQIRLVAQRLHNGTVFDFAFHLSYELNATDFDTLVGELKDFKEQSPVPTKGRALTVHPGLAKAGLDSEYYHLLRDLILRFAGVENLLRFTFTNLRFANDMGPQLTWKMGSVTFVNNRPIIEPIAVQKWPAQFLFSLVDNQINFPNFYVDPLTATNGSIPLLPPDRTSIGPLLGSPQQITDLSPQRFRQALRATHQIENPHRRDFFNADCISCHVANKARNLGFKLKQRQQRPRLETYKNPRYNLAIQHDPTNLDMRHLRAFSYVTHGIEAENPTTVTEASIIPRTIFESAEVADALNDLEN